ncbi:hypothetical protein [Fodinibacter luteus]
MSTSRALRTSGVLAATALAGLLLAAPAQAIPDPGTGGRDFPPGTFGPAPKGTTIVVDDDAVEYLQIGAGLIAGVALAGAGAAMVSRRHHRDPHPV